MANSANWYVDISGSVLSSVFYDCVSCRGDQEGFLFGDAVTRVTGVISDSQINSEKEEIVISLKNHKQCRRTNSFFNHTGKVDHAVLKELLGSRSEELIGWYRCRRHSTLSMLAREKAIHQSLLTLIAVEKRPFFVFGLFCTDENRLTYAFDQAFHCYNGRTFRTLLKSVGNLGDTSQSEYRMHRQLSTDHHSNLYGQLVSKFSNPGASSKELPSTSGCIHHIQVSLQKGLKELADQVEASEVIRSKLIEETILLQTQLDSLRKNVVDDEVLPVAEEECAPVATPNTPPSIMNAKPLGVTAPRDISFAELGLQRLRKPAVLVAGNQGSDAFSNDTLF